MQLKTLSRLIAQFRDAGSNQNRIRRIRRRAATQSRDVRLQVADAISGGLLEELESRALLAGDPITANLTSGSLVISDLVGGNDSLQLTRSGSDLVITVGAGSTIGTNAGTGDGTNSVAIPIASITAGVTVDAGIGNDSVTLDFTGNINFPVGVTIVDGAGTDAVNLNSDITFASASSLVVTAESVTSGAGVDLTTSGTGAITFTADDVTLNSTGTLVTPNTVTLTPQTASRPINLGTETAGSLSLTDTELDTISAGTIQIGNTNSGAITVSAAITSNRNLSLTTGSGGVVSTGGSLGTTGSTITLNTNGPIGTSANRIQFADNTTTTQQNVVIGSTNQASSVYLDGLGSLTLGNISGGIANTTIDVTARTNLLVAANATINSGTNTASLGADLKADGTGDDGSGTLTVNAGANVYGATVNVRAADVDVASTGNVGNGISTFASITNPQGMAFDSSGNLYVSNSSANSIIKVTPAGIATTFATGMNQPIGLAFSSAGDLYVANQGDSTIRKVTPAGVVSTFATGLTGGLLYGLLFDSTGLLYASNLTGGTIYKVTTGGVVSTFVSGVGQAGMMAFDSSGNIYTTSSGVGSLLRITPAGVVTTFATGMVSPRGIIADGLGNFYVANRDNNTVSKITSAGVVSTFATGFNSPIDVVLDASGKLYVSNSVGNTVSKVVLSAPNTTQLNVRSSLASRPMNLGGAAAAVTGINLTDAELARLFTGSNGTITFGDTSQTGDVTFSTATAATTAGAATTVIQSTAGAGKIVLDDGANTGTALNGNGGLISLTAGTGGITATAANNTSAEISTTGATVTMNTTGPIGTSANRVQFANNTNTAQQNVVIGSTNQASSVFLGGVGSLTLGAINDSTRNAAIDVTAGNQLVVTAAISTLGGNINFAAANGVTLTGAAAAVSTVGGSTATLSQAGSDLTTNDAWRTSGVVKTRDADGDNIYGTAGYYLYGSASSQPTLVPSFATVAVAAGTLQVGPDAGYVRLDDPALTGVGPVANVSTGTRYRASQAANQEGDLVVITITQAGSFRLGVIQDNHDLTAISPLSLRVRQTTGGAADSGYLSATAERNLDGDYFFFDFVNAQVGSVYTLSGVNDGGFPSNGIYGVTFDKIQGGTYTVNADTDNDGGGAYIQNNAGSTAATGGGNVSITAADATLLGTTNAGGGRVTIVPTNSRQIDLGTNAANKLGLTDTELDGITAGTIQVGDTNSGAITLSAAITSNTNLALTTGANGVISTGGSLGTTGATVTMNTTGPIGTSANRIQFADNTTTTQQNVVIGSINQASSVYLDGLGSLTLGSISGGTANTTIDVTARTNLVVAASATINSGTSTNSLGADLTAASAGDNGTGTFTVNASANVLGTNITVRGADADVNATANVGNAGTPVVSTLASGFLTFGVAFYNGNLYVADQNNNRVLQITPGGSSTVYATGFTQPRDVAFDSAGNMYVANFGGNSISKVAPGGGSSAVFATGFNSPQGITVDASDNIYVANAGNNLVSKVTVSAAGVFSAVNHSFSSPGATLQRVRFFSDGNLYASGTFGVKKINTATGVATAFVAASSNVYSDMAFDAATGVIYAIDGVFSTVYAINTSGAVSNYLTGNGLVNPATIARDPSGNLYVGNHVTSSVFKITPPTATQVIVRSSQSSRPMAIGGGSVVAGINLSDAELARFVTTAAGTITFGDTAQTGDITFTTATTATTAGASTTVIQSTAGAGKIVLDDGANTGTALNGNGGLISLTAGTGGITATAANNTSAEISTTGATVTMNTSGPIGTSANRIQFADNTNTAQQNVVIGSTTQASSVYLDGLGSLTLGSISGSTANTTIDVTTRTNLVVAASATINSGTSSVSLGADLTAAGAGDNSVGTLSIGSGASVFAASMTLRGADVDIAGTANVGMAIASSTTTISNVISTGLNSPRGAAFDSAGNLYVANQSGAITKVTFSSPGVVNQVVTNFATVGALPDGLVFDAAGNMYSANGAGTISKITFSSPGVLGTVNNSFISTGLNAPVALVFDSTGNLFIANYGNGKISKATFTSPGVFGTLSDFADLTSLGVTGAGSITIDPSNNLYVASNSKIVKVTPAGAASVIVSSGIANDFTIAYFQGTLLAARSTTTLGQYSTSGTLLNASYATSLNTTWQTAPDSQGNLWVVNTGSNSVSKVVPNPTLTQLSLRPSVSSLPMSIGGTNNALTGINLTDSELAKIFSTSTGSIIFGDSSQTGDITFTTATVATTAGASTTVIQSASGAGKIVLDNSAGNGSALNGNSGNVSLTAGTGGIVEASTNTTAAADIVNAATTSLVSAGAIGTAILPVQIGATNLNTNSSTNNSNQFLRATGAVTIDATGVSAGTGTVTLVGGTVSLGGSNRIADATKLTVSGGTLAIGAFSDAVSTVTLKSGSITGSGGSLTSTNTIQTESGSVSAILAGSNGLTQSTAGTTTLSGANTFTGITTLSAGTLALSGSSTNNIASTTTIDVQSGAILNVTGLTSGTLVLANGQTLKGQGTVTGKTTAANGSIVAPGASPGVLNTGDITFNSGSTFSVELNGTSVGSLYDLLNVTGTVTINDGNLNVSLGYVPANGDSFVIVNNDSTDPVTVTNPFKVGGSPVPEGGSFILGGNRFVLTYAGGTNNNDVVLTVQNNTAPTAVVLSPSSASLAEDVSTAADTLLSTIAITDDGSGTNTLSLSGSDAASFRIVGNQLFLKAGVVLDFETKSSYTVRVNVDDTTVGGTPDAFVDFTLTITDVNEAPTAVVLTPGSASLAEDVSTSLFTILSTISITDDALGTNVLSLSGADAASFEIVAGKLRLKAAVVLDFETKSSYSVRVNVDDATIGGTPDAFADFVLSITDVAEDTTRPSSSVNALPLNATSLSISITVTGFDPTGVEGPASGVKEYDLYVATAGGTFSKFATVSASSPTTVFTASSNQVYYFRSIARDNAGNVELDNGADAFIRVGDFDKPVSLVTSAVANSAGLFTITATGSDTGGGRVSRFDIYVSVDGGSATLVGSANAISNSGTLTYSGIVDNASHTYRFTSRAVDTAGNTEDAHSAADVTTTATFAAPASFQGTGIDVQLGATQRSYVRYVDVLFNDATGVSALTQVNRVQVEKFGLTAADVTAGTGAAVPFTVVQIGSSNRLRLDFGVQGVGGARNSTAGDGFYRVRVDANGDGDYTDAGESFEFFRLLGDANGNAVIDALDTTVVDNLFGQIGTNLEGDLNGDGVVNTADKNFTLSRNRGRKLRDEWKSLLDD